VVGRQNVDIADTLHLRDVAMATIFWLSICGVHSGATSRIRLNRPCAAAMRSYVIVKLLWPLVFCFFSTHRFFDVPEPTFAKLYTTWYALKLTVSYGSDYTRTLKNWGAKTPNFRQFADRKSTLWALPFHSAMEIRKLKQ